MDPIRLEFMETEETKKSTSSSVVSSKMIIHSPSASAFSTPSRSSVSSDQSSQGRRSFYLSSSLSGVPGVTEATPGSSTSASSNATSSERSGLNATARAHRVLKSRERGLHHQQQKQQYSSEKVMASPMVSSPAKHQPVMTDSAIRYKSGGSSVRSSGTNTQYSVSSGREKSSTASRSASENDDMEEAGSITMVESLAMANWTPLQDLAESIVSRSTASGSHHLDGDEPMDPSESFCVSTPLRGAVESCASSVVSVEDAVKTCSDVGSEPLVGWLMTPQTDIQDTSEAKSRDGSSRKASSTKSQNQYTSADDNASKASHSNSMQSQTTRAMESMASSVISQIRDFAMPYVSPSASRSDDVAESASQDDDDELDMGELVQELQQRSKEWDEKKEEPETAEMDIMHEKEEEVEYLNSLKTDTRQWEVPRTSSSMAHDQVDFRARSHLQPSNEVLYRMNHDDAVPQDLTDSINMTVSSSMEEILKIDETVEDEIEHYYMSNHSTDDGDKTEGENEFLPQQINADEHDEGSPGKSQVSTNDDVAAVPWAEIEHQNKEDSFLEQDHAAEEQPSLRGSFHLPSREKQVISASEMTETKITSSKLPPRPDPALHASTARAQSQPHAGRDAADEVTPTKAQTRPRAVTPLMRMRYGDVEPAAPTIDRADDVIVPAMKPAPASKPVPAYIGDDDVDDDESEHRNKEEQRRQTKEKSSPSAKTHAERKKSKKKDKMRHGTSVASSKVSISRGSSVGTRLIDDDTAFTAKSALSCQDGLRVMLGRLLQSKCGNLDDTISIDDDTSSGDESSESEETESEPEETIEATKRPGRIVSFDDESELSTDRRQLVLDHMRKSRHEERRTKQEEILHTSAHLETAAYNDEDQQAARLTRNENDKTRGGVARHSSDPVSNAHNGERSTERLKQEEHAVKEQCVIDLTRSGGHENKISQAKNHFSRSSKVSIDDGPVGSDHLRSREFERKKTPFEELEARRKNSAREPSSLARNQASSPPSTIRAPSPGTHQRRVTPSPSNRASSPLVEKISQSPAPLVRSASPQVQRYDARQGDVLIPSRQGALDIKKVEPKSKLEKSPLRKVQKSVLEEVELHDRRFVKAFVDVTTTTGLSLMCHSMQRRNKTVTPGLLVTAYLRLGVKSKSGIYSEPSLVLESEGQLRVAEIEIFDIRSLAKASALDLESYPFAMPGRSIILNAYRGNTYVLEAPTEDRALRIIHGMRWVIARLTFNVIIGNVNVSCELLESDEDGKKSTTVATAQRIEALRSNAMNDVANHLVDKVILNS